MVDYKHNTERTLPRPIHGYHSPRPQPDLGHRHGDITVTKADGTQYTIKSKDMAQITYDKKTQGGKKDGRNK